MAVYIKIASTQLVLVPERFNLYIYIGGRPLIPVISTPPCRKVITEKPNAEKSLLTKPVLKSHNWQSQSWKAITKKWEIFSREGNQSFRLLYKTLWEFNVRVMFDLHLLDFHLSKDAIHAYEIVRIEWKCCQNRAVCSISEPFMRQTGLKYIRIK